ncbi:hypothetical protein [Methylorubrum populi]|uniref:hypothetical protein n=1 Tax=Methylorubrum populi TaxID=223967 RepID=UPI000DB41389|nr:hypothetical protein [Methylorubrum populi]PZP71750.1 MAG: hypothetical protein DI590_05665 [Methylorubrum populi]
MGKTVDNVLFPTRNVQEEGGERRKHHIIACSHCPSEATARAATGAGGLGNEMLTRKFTRLGWYVSRSPGGHLCPTCNPTKERAVLTVVRSEPEKEEPVAQPTPVTVRDMSFADRRIINSKLEEVYENELLGYRVGWDDEKVARDLGVETAWVTELRGQNFGPARGNQAIIEIQTEQKQLRKDLEAFRAEGERLTKRVIALGEKLQATGLANAA